MGAEISVVIIAASLPVLGPLFLHRFGRGPANRIPTLPILEVHVESVSRRALTNIRSLPQSGLSSPSGFTVKSDPESRGTLRGIRTSRCYGRSLRVIKTIDVTVASMEMTEDIILDGEIVPEDLQKHNSAEESMQTSPLDSWDEIPTPPFLTDTSHLEYGLE